MSGPKYSIKAHDSCIGAQSQTLRVRILKQILVYQPNKTSQLKTVLSPAVGERTDTSLNTRTDDGLKNGTSNIIKLIQIQQTSKPSGIIWVQFDCADIGDKTRHDNRHLFVQCQYRSAELPLGMCPHCFCLCLPYWICHSANRFV